MRWALCAVRVVVKACGNREASDLLSSKGGWYYPRAGKDVHDGQGMGFSLLEKFHNPDPREKREGDDLISS